MQPTSQLNEEHCYQAVRSRDARFDGRFFTAVLTTGIYCRPVCPAVTPQRKNVRFYLWAAAAEEAGFRPCRRCRPDAAPATPAWLGTSATVLRGLRCIEEGALDSGSAQDLADRLGMGEGLTLRVPVRAPYDWASLIAFFTPRAIPGVEQVTPAAYRRSMLIEGNFHLVEVTFEPRVPHLVISVQPPLVRGLIGVVQRVGALFDAGADPRPIREHLRRDVGLRPLVRAHPGLRVPGAWDGFELGVRAILGQQVSVAGATTLAGRLVREYGAQVEEGTGGPTHAFPAAVRLAEADLAKIGLPGARARALRGFAEEVASGRLSVSPAAPPQETRDRLLAIPGLGPWTTEYIALRALRDPDAFPAGDLGLRRALSSGAALISEKALRTRAEAWRPWRAYAALHLWTALSRTTLSPGEPLRSALSPTAVRRGHARSS